MALLLIGVREGGRPVQQLATTANLISKEQNILRSQTTDIRFRERGVQTVQGNISNLHLTHMRSAAAIIKTARHVMFA